MFPFYHPYYGTVDSQMLAQMRYGQQSYIGKAVQIDPGLANIAMRYTPMQSCGPEYVNEAFVETEEKRAQKELYPPEDYPYLYEMKWRKA